ncbi:lymphocyte function-associated antigen 3 isoform X2 [Myotis lucifugus]|uniref:lymphocyte function-associated antigen 3 isoform X2 n=1 Tax=Myotis lucifugus TaxID=59463 RepID=UPI000CCC95F3|nr:lymphocyte function-associated antigen 3 isoform X2 [Myotis lucifugus]
MRHGRGSPSPVQLGAPARIKDSQELPSLNPVILRLKSIVTAAPSHRYLCLHCYRASLGDPSAHGPLVTLTANPLERGDVLHQPFPMPRASHGGRFAHPSRRIFPLLPHSAFTECLWGFISCQLMRFGSIGGNITLSPSSTVNFTEIIWKKGKDKVTEWSTNFNVTTYSLLEGRVHLDPKSGDLTISNLTSSDEGEYEMKSMDLTDSSKFHLTVLDPLRSPTLNCTVTNEIISVHCKMPQSYRRHRELLRYAWHCPFPQCEGSWELEAPVLNFTKEGDLSREVRCFVKNQESNRTSSIVLSTCVPSDNSRHRYALTAVPFAVIVCAVGFLNCARRTD